MEVKEEILERIRKIHFKDNKKRGNDLGDISVFWDNDSKYVIMALDLVLGKKKKTNKKIEELHEFIADKYDEHKNTRNLSKFTYQIREKIEELFPRGK